MWFALRLVQECKQSPGKATVLGVLLVVGLWVYWPRWQTSVPVQAAPAPQAAVAAEASIPFPWQQWARQGGKDPWKHPSPEVLQNAAAFAPLVKQLSGSAARQQTHAPTAEKAREEPPTPPSWQLQGICWGGGRAVALIDGRAYLPGDKLHWKDQEYTLRWITRRSAVLQTVQGQTLELRLPRRGQDPRIRLRRVSAQENPANGS